MNYYIKDFREDSLARIEGPFDKKTAEEGAEQLCQFVARNDGLAWLTKLTGAKVKGPFFAIPETSLSHAEKREIARLARV
jgi:hypothetical protein